MCVRPYAQYINEVFNINRLHIAQKVIAITNPVNGVDFLKWTNYCVLQIILNFGIWFVNDLSKLPMYVSYNIFEFIQCQ